MTTSLAGFNAAQVDPNFGGAGFFPKSDEKGHLVIIVADNGWKPAKSGEGQYLELMLKAQEGPIAGQEAPLRLNLQHVKPNAVSAAQAQLSAICHVVGVLTPGTTADLFNRPFRVVSELQDANKPDGYTQLANNGIRDVNGNKPGQAQSGPVSGQPAQPQQPQQPQQPSQPQQGGQPAFGAPQGGQAPQGVAGAAGPGWGSAPQGGGAVGGGQGWGQPQQGGQAPQGGAPGWAQG